MSVKAIRDMEQVADLSNTDLFMVETNEGTKSTSFEQMGIPEIKEILNSLTSEGYPKYDITTGNNLRDAILYAGNGCKADGSDAPEGFSLYKQLLREGDYYYTNKDTLGGTLPAIVIANRGTVSTKLPLDAESQGVILVRKIPCIIKDGTENQITENTTMCAILFNKFVTYYSFPVKQEVRDDGSLKYSFVWKRQSFEEPLYACGLLLDEYDNPIVDEETGENIICKDKGFPEFTNTSQSAKIVSSKIEFNQLVTPGIHRITGLEDVDATLFAGIGECMMVVYRQDVGEGVTRVRRVIHGNDASSLGAPKLFIQDGQMNYNDINAAFSFSDWKEIGTDHNNQYMIGTKKCQIQQISGEQVLVFQLAEQPVSKDSVYKYKLLNNRIKPTEARKNYMDIEFSLSQDGNNRWEYKITDTLGQVSNVYYDNSDANNNYNRKYNLGNIDSHFNGVEILFETDVSYEYLPQVGCMLPLNSSSDVNAATQMGITAKVADTLMRFSQLEVIKTVG